MSESSSSAWPILCGVIAVLGIGAAAALFMQNQAMQSRWQSEAEMLSQEMNAVAQKMADESYARNKAEAQISVLKAQIDDLMRQLAEAKRSIPPAQ